MFVKTEEHPFAEPWQAQAFALAVLLHEKDVFTWNEWAAALSASIKNAQAAGDADLGDTYYHHWLATIEQLVQSKAVLSQEQLSARQQAWREAALRTPHGMPIEL